MAVALHHIETPQQMEVDVSGPADANKLFIFTGIAVFTFKGTGQAWKGDTLTFEVGPQFTANQFKSAVVTASLASIANAGHAINAGWSVNSAEAVRSSSSGKTKLTFNLAVRDSDGYLYRIGYEACVLVDLRPIIKPKAPVVKKAKG